MLGVHSAGGALKTPVQLMVPIRSVSKGGDYASNGFVARDRGQRVTCATQNYAFENFVPWKRLHGCRACVMKARPRPRPGLPDTQARLSRAISGCRADHSKSRSAPGVTVNASTLAPATATSMPSAVVRGACVCTPCPPCRQAIGVHGMRVGGAPAFPLVHPLGNAPLN